MLPGRITNSKKSVLHPRILLSHHNKILQQRNNTIGYQQLAENMLNTYCC